MSGEEIKEAKIVGQDFVEKGLGPKIAKFGKRVPFLREAIALFQLLGDPTVSRVKKAMAASALAYFILPLDAIVDVSPLIGFLDDAGVIAVAVSYLEKELKRYLT